MREMSKEQFQSELESVSYYLSAAGLDGADATVVLSAALAGLAQANAGDQELPAAVEEICAMIRQFAGTVEPPAAAH